MKTLLYVLIDSLIKLFYYKITLYFCVFQTSGYIGWLDLYEVRHHMSCGWYLKLKYLILFIYWLSTAVLLAVIVAPLQPQVTPGQNKY